MRATGITSRSTSTLTEGRRGTSTNWPNTCSRRGARPTTSTPSPCSSTSSRALIGTFKRHNLHLPRLMPPSHAGTCACVTILLLITLHAKPTDYIRGYQRHRWQCTTSLVSQLKLFPSCLLSLWHASCPTASMDRNKGHSSNSSHLPDSHLNSSTTIIICHSSVWIALEVLKSQKW